MGLASLFWVRGGAEPQVPPPKQTGTFWGWGYSIKWLPAIERGDLGVGDVDAVAVG